MMSKKQFCCMLALHIVYLLVGASIFYHIESPVELAQRAEEKLERLEIQNLLYENYIPNDPDKQDSILRKLSEYCGKPMFNYTTEDEEAPFKWDFYHSVFFSYTVVSTIGYGNLVPTTNLSRILMMFYALFGIPINGILLANLGEYFGLQLISVYRNYKKRNEKRADNLDYFFHNLGLLGQIFLYLIPGFLFFIFLPACILVVFEGWDYIEAIYFAYVTLTTIGFGDFVAGTVNNGFSYGYYLAYEIFLLVWITFGLGYIVMLLGFITSGMRSEKVHRLEQKLAYQFKTTQNKILQGFSRDIAIIRKIVNEANLIKLKPVYVEATPHLCRSRSCPILTFDIEPRNPVFKRKRANSENIHILARDMLRIQSDTDLLGIDREKTFSTTAIVKPTDLLARVVNVIGGLEQSQKDKGVHMFDDDQILASEKPLKFSIGSELIDKSSMRTRALSVAVPNYRKESLVRLDHDFTWTNGDTGDKFRREANIRSGKFSLPNSEIQRINVENIPTRNFLSRLFMKKSSSTEIQSEYINNTDSGRSSIEHKTSHKRGSHLPHDEILELDKEKIKRIKQSLFPTFDFRKDNESTENEYKEKTKRRRHSIFPTFDFSEDEEEEEQIKKYQNKTKRHSIFPTFYFSDDDEETNARKYIENPQDRRRSIFPTFDFSSPRNDDDDNDSIDQEELRKYHSRTRKGRVSLFPTFGKSTKNDEDTNPQNSNENNSQRKPRQRRGSLFPTFGKNRKTSAPTNGSNDLEASIKEFQRSRNSTVDINSKNAGHIRRKRSFDNELDNYRRRTERGRPSLFDPNVNLTLLPKSEQMEALEQTSVADLIRALAVLETAAPQDSTSSNNLGLLGLITEPPPLTSRRRSSLKPDFTLPDKDDIDEFSGQRRRVSARPVAQFTPTLATVVAGAELQTTASSARENRMSMLIQPPPSYSETIKKEEDKPARVRRFSPVAGSPSRFNSGPVSRLYSRMRKDSVVPIEEDKSRRNSLTDIVVDKNNENA